MKRTIYSGYTVWPDGLSVWPSRKRKWRWADLVALRSAFGPQGTVLSTMLVFRGSKALTLQASRVFSFGTGQGRFAELIAQAVAAAPEATAIDELTFEIAQWGPRDIRKRLMDQGGYAVGAARWVERARHHRVWLEKARALQAVETALAQDRHHREALKFRHQWLLEQGKTRKAREAAEQWVDRQPEDASARIALVLMQLADNEPTAVKEAAELLAADPGQEELAAGLAAAHFRAGRYAEAAAIWQKVAEVTGSSVIREQARERQVYAEKSGRDPGFRRRETLKHWGRQSLAWSGLVVFILLQLGGAYTRCTREERETELRQVQEKDRQEWAEKMKQRLAESDRSFTELTGRVTGRYAEVRARADQGEAAAQLTVAEWLFDGTQGAPKDPVAALDYLEKAAAQEHRAALLSLGENMVEGKRIPKDTARAASLFERAMAQGSSRAAAELAALHERGEGVPRDGAKAFELYARAAEGGYVHGMNQAGWLLERGEGVPADRARALAYYRQAAEKKSDWATDRLVRLLFTRQGGVTEQEEAWQWMKKGAMRGMDTMRRRAANMVLTGYRDDDEVAAVARDWLEQAVTQNQPGARTELGQCLLHGRGMPQDFARATELFAADEANHEPARMLLARNLAFGVGVKRDPARARVLLDSLKDPALRARLEKYLVAAETRVEPGEQPVALHREAPAYPLRLRRKGVDGDVRVTFRINAEGFTEHLQVHAATHPDFASEARLAIAFWRFHPAPAHLERDFEQLLEFRSEDHAEHAGRETP